MAGRKNNKNKAVFNAVLCSSIFCYVVFAELASAAHVEFGGVVSKRVYSGLRPSRSIVHTFKDEAGIRIYSTNTKSSAATMSLLVMDGQNHAISAEVLPPVMRLKSHATGEFVVIIPMGGDLTRKFRICAEYSGVAELAQCGTYLAKRVGWS